MFNFKDSILLVFSLVATGLFGILLTFALVKFFKKLHGIGKDGTFACSYHVKFKDLLTTPDISSADFSEWVRVQSKTEKGYLVLSRLSDKDLKVFLSDKLSLPASQIIIAPTRIYVP